MKSRQFFAAIALASFSFAPSTYAATITNNDPIEKPAPAAAINVSAVAKSLVLNLGSVIKETVLVKIADEQGNVVFSETVKNAPNFRRTYNLSNLEDGNYSLVVTKTTMKTTQPFAIENEAITLSQAMQEEKYVPVFGFDKDKLSVNFLMKEKGKATVKIYDNEGKSILTELNPSVLALHKRYDTSKLPSGAYFIEVTNSEESFTYSFVK